MVTAPIRILALHWFDVCSPWRVTIPLRALAQRGYELREQRITNVQPEDLGNADIVVLHRPNSPEALSVMTEARRRNIATVVDMDDLFLPDQLPARAPFSRVWHPLFKRWDAEEQVAVGIADAAAVNAATRNNVMELLHGCLCAADVVTVSTEPLAAAYAPFNANQQIVPNCYDDANPLWSLPPAQRATVNIGFAGTEHHADNLALLRRALEPVLDAHPEARIVEAGVPDLLPLIDAPAHQLVHLGTVPFEVFPLLLREMDIVLAPLADEPFMRCKSNIRCMTAGLLGLPVVASPVGPYAEYVEDGYNGFHARTPEEWTTALNRLVSDTELRRAMGANNRARAGAYAISTNVTRWAEVYDSLLSCRRCA